VTEQPRGSTATGLALSDTALLEMLVLEAPVAFAFYDTDLRYRRINRMLADMNGLPMDAHIARRPTDVLPAALGQAVETRLRHVLLTGEVISDLDFTAASPVTGEQRHYESQWFPATAPDGTVIGVAVLVTDITERRRSEHALQRSTRRTAELQRATAALAEALTVAQVREVVRGIGASLGAATAALMVGPGDQGAGGPAAPEGRAVALPLLLGGDQIGTLRLTWDEPVEEDLTFLAALAGQCAIALERARLYERERSTAVALQQSLLPDQLPEVPGVQLAARFSPGSPGADVGGDWYDAFALADGRVVLVVGDVMGKGVQAAAGMGRLRAALRALAHANPLPEAVLTGLDRVFAATEGPDQIATLVYLLVDPRARRAAISGAGHLPLLLRRAGSPPQLIDAGNGTTPLGWPDARCQQTLELGPGDVLIGFTDGLVERRGADIDEGVDDLRRLVAAGPDDLVQLVTLVGEALTAEAAGRDDATVLGLRFTG